MLWGYDLAMDLVEEAEHLNGVTLALIEGFQGLNNRKDVSHR